MTLRYLDVCSGISAPSVAWAPFGWRCAGYAEIEAFPRAVLEDRHGAVAVDFDHRWSEGQNTTPLFGDFTKIEAHHVRPIDLLVGGTPCQSFSVAGKRLGLDDPRGNLTLEFLALAKRVRPRWIVWENVPGVLSDDGGATMGTFLRLLGELGYGWAYRVLDAQFIRVDGFARAVPQRRRRVFVVGYFGDPARAATVLFERESLSGHPAPRREAGKGVAPTISARTKGGGGLGTDFDCDGGLICADVAPTLNAHFGDKQGLENQHIDGGGDCLSPPLAMCLNAGAMGRQDAESETLIAVNRCGFDVAHSLRADGFDASEDGTGRGTPLVPVAYAIQERAVSENTDAGPDGAGFSEAGAAYTLEARHHVQAVVFAQNTRDEVRLFGGDGASVGALAAEPGMKQQSYVAYDLRGREGGAQFEGPHPTANVRAADGSSSRSYVAEAWAVRRLTPTECERLQAFPDGFTDVTYRKKPAADGPRYKALGNSMAVNVVRWIGLGIQAVEAIPAEQERAA
jgi:DNA (cytosine-5)-methyltransferase 1